MATRLVFDPATDTLLSVGGVPNTHTVERTTALCVCHTPPRPAVLAHAHISGPFGAAAWVHMDMPRPGWVRGATVRDAEPGSCAACAPAYDGDDRCSACGEHIADPHAPGCPNDPDPVTPVA